MARPQEFDRDAVVDKAIEVFWSKGYEATSIQDLVEATDINRGSLYNTFGDKAGLFTAAMERYSASSPSKRVIDAAEAGPPRETIENLFAEIVDHGAADAKCRGCLVTNTATEMTGRDNAVAERIRTNMQRLEDAFLQLIERGQACGEIAPWRAPRELARFLVASAQGMQVIAKVESDWHALQDIADTVLSNLD